MSDKQFLDSGAECVGGDLILNRVVVGQYRNGQFVLTEAGAAMAKLEANTIDVEAKVVKPRTKKADKAAAPEPVVDDGSDLLAGLNLDA